VTLYTRYEINQKIYCYRADGPYHPWQSNLTGGFQYHDQRRRRDVAQDDGDDIPTL